MTNDKMPLPGGYYIGGEHDDILCDAKGKSANLWHNEDWRQFAAAMNAAALQPQHSASEAAKELESMFVRTVADYEPSEYFRQIVRQKVQAALEAYAMTVAATLTAGKDAEIARLAAWIKYELGYCEDPKFKSNANAGAAYMLKKMLRDFPALATPSTAQGESQKESNVDA